MDVPIKTQTERDALDKIILNLFDIVDNIGLIDILTGKTTVNGNVLPIGITQSSLAEMIKIATTFKFKGIVYQPYGKLFEGFRNEGFAAPTVDLSTLTDSKGASANTPSAGGITAYSSSGMSMTTVAGICVVVAAVAAGGTYLVMNKSATV